MFERVVELKVRSRPDQAFQHIGPGFFEHHGVWDPSVRSMIRTSEGPVAAGTSGIEVRQFGPWSIRSEFRVTEFEADRRFAFRTTKGPMIEDVAWTIEPAGQGSSVRFRLCLTPASRAFRLMEPFMRPMLGRNVVRNAARMRQALDALAEGRSESEATAKSGVSRSLVS